MTRHARTRPLTIGANDRAHVMVNLTAEEAAEIQAAAHGLPVATWCRWAILSTARLLNARTSQPPSCSELGSTAYRGTTISTIKG